MAGFENLASPTSESQSLLSGLSSAIKSRSTAVAGRSGADSVFDNVLKGRQDQARDQFARDAADNRRNQRDNAVERSAPDQGRRPEANVRPDAIDRSVDLGSKARSDARSQARSEDHAESKIDRHQPNPDQKHDQKVDNIDRSASSEKPVDASETKKVSEDAAPSDIDPETATDVKFVVEPEIEAVATTTDQTAPETSQTTALETSLTDEIAAPETPEVAVALVEQESEATDTSEETASLETAKTDEKVVVKTDTEVATPIDLPEEQVLAQGEMGETEQVALNTATTETEAAQPQIIATNQSISPELATEAAAKQGSTTSDALAANAKKAADQAAAASADDAKVNGSSSKEDPAATTNQRAASAEASVALKAAALAQKGQNPAARANTAAKITANAPTLEALTGTSPNGQSNGANAASATFKATTPPAQGSLPNLPVRSIALHIANKVADGITSFQIRLDPPELGRIDVKMKIAGDGQVTTHLTVDRPETLEALQRDQRGLERTLQNAGLDTDGGLSFDLRDETQAEGDGPNGGGTSTEGEDGLGSDGSEELAQDGPVHHISLSAIDIRI